MDCFVDELMSLDLRIHRDMEYLDLWILSWIENSDQYMN